MKNLLAATVIFLSSCTAAHADYAEVKACSDIGKYTAHLRNSIVLNKMTEAEAIADIKQHGVNNGTPMVLVSFAESGRSVYDSPYDWYKAGAEACLKFLQITRYHGPNSYEMRVFLDEQYGGKGW